MAFPFSSNNLPTQLFINNEYVDSRSTQKLSVYNPKDGTLVTDQVPLSGAEDVDAAVAAAEAAFPAWKKTSAIERREKMLKFASLLQQHLEQLSELTRITLGAPFRTFGCFEASMASEMFTYYAGWTDKFGGESFPQDNGFLKFTRHEPLGVTAGIAPWNGPMGTIGLKAAPALATGNCFILKPSEKTPLGALALGPLIKEAGFPPGVFQILSGDGSTGDLLARHMRIRKVSFTGSIPTGKKVQRAAAETNLKRVTLELGGKSPAVVFDDCHLENAVSWCARITANTGQVCFAPSRVYVQEGIKDQFIAKYKLALEEVGKAVGDPDHPSTLMGPIVDKAQFSRVMGFIERGANQGILLTGGSRVGETGLYVAPTVFTDVESSSELLQNEIFGPVAVVNTFKTEEEVIREANATEYGLMAGVFTQDINRALRVASEFESGMVGVNAVSLVQTELPFGGSKQSGTGRECGRAALEAFTETKTVMINLTY